MARKSKPSKALFFAVIAVAVALIGVGIASLSIGRGWLPPINDDPWNFDTTGGSGGFSILMDLQLLENGNVVESWSAADGPKDPLSVLGNWFAIVWQGPAGDKALDFTSNTYTIRAAPTWTVSTKDLSGSNARIDLAVTSAEWKWKSTGAYATLYGPVSGAYDTASVAWAITNATATKALSAGTRVADLSVVDASPPPSGGMASLYIKFSYTLTLTVDGTVVDSKADSTVCEIVFKNTTGGAFSSVSVSFATSLDTYPIYYGGTP